MIVVLKGDCCLPSSPFGPDLFRSWSGPLFKSGRVPISTSRQRQLRQVALPDRSAKINLRTG
jgi:hypothetical protein